MSAKKLAISWAPYSRRSQSMADEFAMQAHCIHYLKYQRPFYAPLKYILQALHTFVLLIIKQPDIVFVQDPPIFASLIVYIYTQFTLGRTRFIVDAHSGALLHPWWKPLRGLQKFIYRRAQTVITTNQTLTSLIRSWNVNSIALAGPPIYIPPGPSRKMEEELFNLVLVNTFSIDEPLHLAMEAVADLPEVHLYVTGNKKKAPLSLLEKAPSNVTFTGFLPDDKYLELLRGTDAIMVLTNEDFTLQLGGMEAVAVGKPILISDYSLLREYFHCGAVYTPNTAEEIQQGILRLQEDVNRLSKEILELRRAHQKKWELESQRLYKLF